jgi:hypothetical protein
MNKHIRNSITYVLMGTILSGMIFYLFSLDSTANAEKSNISNNTKNIGNLSLELTLPNGTTFNLLDDMPADIICSEGSIWAALGLC